MSRNRLLEPSRGRTDSEQNKQRLLFLQCTWDRNLSFLFYKYCALQSLLMCFAEVRTSQLSHFEVQGGSNITGTVCV